MKTKRKITKTEKGEEIDKLLKIITKECENAGWRWTIEALDEKGFLSATVSISKIVSYQEISAFINIIIRSGSIQYGIEKTSFHGYGIEALFSVISNAVERAGYKNKDNKSEKKESSTIDILLQIFEKFHISAIQLSKRHDNRQTLNINDEYDVQDYLHALLKIYFNDIRPEEHTPSYAGASSRIDFLLKDEKILVEVKFATTKLKDNKIGEELIIDTERYKNHPDCESLFCFVYDPNFNIKNPYGLEKDLSGKKDKMDIKVFIYPK